MKSGKTTTYLREINQKTVLNIIRKGSTSRSEIARQTGLTKPAVSAIVENLIHQDFIEEVGQDDIVRGRHPELLSIKPNAHYAIGVDISRDSYSAGICDLTGKPVASFSSEDLDSPPTIITNQICTEVKKLLAKHRIPMSKILGIGINVPGPVDTHTGEILNPPNFSDWNNFNVLEPFRNEFDLPVFVENDSTSYALAENLFGQGSKYNNYFMIVLVDGVGSSLILNGKPYKGQRGLNPEIGHVSINIDGGECECGNRGCVELYTSIPHVIKRANQLGISVNSWKEIVDRAWNQDQEALKIVREQATYFAFTIHNVVNIFAPEAVIFAGKIQYKSDLLLTLIKNEVYSNMLPKGMPAPSILMSHIEESSSILAACSVVFSDFFYV